MTRPLPRARSSFSLSSGSSSSHYCCKTFRTHQYPWKFFQGTKSRAGLSSGWTDLKHSVGSKPVFFCFVAKSLKKSYHDPHFLFCSKERWKGGHAIGQTVSSSVSSLSLSLSEFVLRWAHNPKLKLLRFEKQIPRFQVGAAINSPFWIRWKHGETNEDGGRSIRIIIVSQGKESNSLGNMMKAANKSSI